MGTGVHKYLRRQDIMFEDKDQALRDDVRMLGTLVGELIREQGGDGLFEFVENARLRSIRRRENNEIEGEELADLVDDLEPDPPRDERMPHLVEEDRDDEERGRDQATEDLGGRSSGGHGQEGQHTEEHEEPGVEAHRHAEGSEQFESAAHGSVITGRRRTAAPVSAAE